MADAIPRMLLEIQGWAGALEVSHADTLEMLALLRHGHPRAQDFEPTGHGGSDPTSVNGTRPDTAVTDGKRYTAAIERAWKALREADDIAHRYRHAVKPERKQDDLDDVWCVIHWQLGYPEPRAHLDLCDPCYRYKVNHNGQYPTKDDVEYYIAHYGRWPTQRIDPTKPRVDHMRIDSRRIAGLENLQDGFATLTDVTST